MSIKSDLNTLKTNIQNAKDKLYTNLTNKGVSTITTASTLDAMVDSVSDITVGESSGTELIFTIPDGYNYSKCLDWIYYVDTSNMTSMQAMLSSFTLSQPSLSLDLRHFDTSNVTNMSSMFKGSYGLLSLDLSSFDTSNVTNMNSMFTNCSGLTSLDLSSFDTSKVTTMNGMFQSNTVGYNMGFKEIIFPNNFGSSCTDMNYMFTNCGNLTSLDLSSFDTSNVTTMNSMFSYCGNLTSLDLSSFDTSNVTTMGSMFTNCSGLTSLDLSSFDTSNVTTMNSMFTNCSGLTSLDLSSFDTSNVTNMNSMFQNCSGLTSLDLSSFDTSKVTNFTGFINMGGIKSVRGIISFKSISQNISNYYLNNYQGDNSILRKITIGDIGYKSGVTSLSFYPIMYWGVDSDEVTDAHQSMIDSLITYSFDRATANYSTCTITLRSYSKNTLTEDEIAQITAKGFTIA